MLFTSDHYNAVADAFSELIHNRPPASELTTDEMVEIEYQIIGIHLGIKRIMQLFYEDNPNFDWKEFVMRVEPSSNLEELNVLEEQMIATLSRTIPFSDDELDELIMRGFESLASLYV